MSLICDNHNEINCLLFMTNQRVCRRTVGQSHSTIRCCRQVTQASSSKKLESEIPIIMKFARISWTCLLLLLYCKWCSSVQLCQKDHQVDLIDPYDGVNQRLEVTNYGWPQCNESREELIGLENGLLLISSFVIVNEDLIVLEDHSLHQNYCLQPQLQEDSNDNKTLAYVCQTKLEIKCSEENCTRKCCQMGQVSKEGLCMASTNLSGDGIEDDDSSLSTFYGVPENCQDLINVGSNFTLERSYLKVDNSKYWIDQYCLLDLLDGSTEAQLCLNHTQDHLVYARIKSISMIVSLVFLNLAGALVWRNHKDKLFGAMTLSLMAMLFIYYLTSLIMDLASPVLNDTVCKMTRYTLQFSQLSAVWWMNSMCIDIWQTFRKLKAPSQVLVRYGWKHPDFLPHAYWATLMPLLVTALTFIIEQFANHYHDTIQGCAMSYHGILYYLIVPMTPVLCFNLICFIKTAIALCCGLWSAEDATSNEITSVKLRVKSVLKIFVATGIAWVSEVVGWFLHYLAESENDQNLVQAMTLPLDLINALQGLTIFLALLSNYAWPWPAFKCQFNNPLRPLYRKWNNRNRQMYNLEMDAVNSRQLSSSQGDSSLIPSFTQTSFSEC